MVKVKKALWLTLFLLVPIFFLFATSNASALEDSGQVEISQASSEAGADTNADNENANDEILEEEASNQVPTDEESENAEAEPEPETEEEETPEEKVEEEPLFTSDEIFENNLELLKEVEPRRYHGELGIGFAFQESSGLTDFLYRYSYPNKAFYLSRFGIRSLHPSHEFLDFILNSPREKSYYSALTILKDGGRIDISSVRESFRSYSLFRDGTLFANPFRYKVKSLKFHNPSYQDWWIGVSVGANEFERRNTRINTQADTRQEWLNADVTLTPYGDSSLRLFFEGERVYRNIGGEKARDAFTYSADLTDPLSEETTLLAGFSYTLAETYSLGGDLDRYRAYASLQGERAFGHDCIDWKLNFRYLNNTGFAYLGLFVDDSVSLGGDLTYDLRALGVFNAGYNFANSDLNLLDFSNLPYELKISPFALETEYEPYTLSRNAKTHSFSISHKVKFGLGFNLRQNFDFERIVGIADSSILDFRYQNLFPTRRLRYKGDLTYEPCPNWRWALSERFERRNNSVRDVSFSTNYLSLSGTYTPDQDSAYTALLGRGDYKSNEPTVSLYETDLVNFGFVVFKRLNENFSAHFSYNFSYSTGRDKFESDDFALYLTISGRHPINIGYEYTKLSEKLYPQSNSRLHNFFLEYEYRF